MPEGRGHEAASSGGEPATEDEIVRITLDALARALR